MKRRLITSALPYVNNVPHLGNLIQVLSADVFARFCRLRGYETLYICGTDEYGTATETRAAFEGLTPRELCDRYHALHTEIYRWFNIDFDRFGRTSTPVQTEVTQDIFRKLDAQGLIAEKEIEQLYCPDCGRFLADRYVRGTCPHCGSEGARGDQCEQCGKLLDPTDLKDPRCSTCGAEPHIRPTRHLYIDLPKIRGRLEEWIGKASVDGFWANNAVQMTRAWIRDGLHERAITRDLKWGIPVPRPGYENKVFYVWFDAPIGYISITGSLGAERGGDWRSFVDYWWKSPEEVELFQFIGKDNIPFHTVIFPSSLLGSGDRWTMLHHMSSTEYLNYESGKFSKSKGIGVFGNDAVETGIPADVWRFYIFYNRPEKADALFTWKDFQEKVNGELIGNFGNLVNRTLSFVSRFYGGKIPGAARDSLPDTDFWKKARDYETEIAEMLERADLRDAFHTLFALSSFANKAFQDGEPWKTRNADPPRAEALLRDLCHVVRDLAIMLEPYLPATAERVAGFFGCTLDRRNPGGKRLLSWQDLGKGLELERAAPAEILFARLEDDLISALREKYAGSQTEREEKKTGGAKSEGGTGAEPAAGADGASSDGAEPAQSIQERFASTLDIRAARIVKIERHPNAEKLYIETLEIAGEERVIVSGLVPYYREEELLNKNILVVYNLKPAKLRGVESRGMLLAAEIKKEDGSLVVEALDAGDAPTGSRVCVEGAEAPAPPPAEITVDTFFTIPLAVENYRVLCGGLPLSVNGKALRTSVIGSGGVH
jgi:methionyl-tRNA synthetase